MEKTTARQPFAVQAASGGFGRVAAALGGLRLLGSRRRVAAWFS